MADFFKLNSDSEEKIVSREEHILANVWRFGQGFDELTATITTAPYLRLKLFIDALEVAIEQGDGQFLNSTYRIGKYFEVEPGEIIRVHSNTTFYDFRYILENRGNGKWGIALLQHNFNEQYTLYCSQLILVDSFNDPAYGWYNPDNPDNIIDKTEDNNNVGNIPDGLAVYTTAFYGDNWYNPLPPAGDESGDEYPVWEGHDFRVVCMGIVENGVPYYSFVITPEGNYAVAPGNSPIGEGQRGNVVGTKISNDVSQQPSGINTIVNNLSATGTSYRVLVRQDELESFIADCDFCWCDVSGYFNKLQLKLRSHFAAGTDVDDPSFNFAWQGVFLEHRKIVDFGNPPE